MGVDEGIGGWIVYEMGFYFIYTVMALSSPIVVWQKPRITERRGIMMKFTADTKRELLKLAIQHFEKEAETLKQSAEEARQGAINAPGRMQSRYDTRKEELSALHGSLQEKYIEMQSAISLIKGIDVRKIDTIRSGAIVKVDDQTQNRPYTYFVIPRGGGEIVRLGDEEISLITFASPLGKALFRHRAGDTVKFVTPEGIRMLKILEVS